MDEHDWLAERFEAVLDTVGVQSELDLMGLGA